MKLQFVFLLLFSILTGCDRERDLDPALLGGNHLRDPAAVLAPADRRMLEKQLALFERETGVDLRIITVELGVGASLEEFTHENLKLHAPVASPRPRGRSADDALGNRRFPATGAALLIYDAQQGRLRVEVGYALEQIFPDAFVGFLIREHARYLFDEGRPAEALLFTVRILRDRIRSAVLSGDLRGPSQNTLAGYAYGGAGASDRAPLGEKALDPFASSSRSKPLAGSSALGSPPYGRAGSSVESAYQHYLAWLAAGRFETHLALFTAETRSFLAEWPMTPGYLEHILTKELGKSFEAMAREDRVLYFCVDDPFVAPHFFVLGDRGWQVDLAAEAREVININGGRFSWSLRDPQKSAWIEPFSDQIVLMRDFRHPSDAATPTRGGVWRFRGGDNRGATLPVSPDRRISRWLRAGSPI